MGAGSSSDAAGIGDSTDESGEEGRRGVAVRDERERPSTLRLREMTGNVVAA